MEATRANYSWRTWKNQTSGGEGRGFGKSGGREAWVSCLDFISNIDFLITHGLLDFKHGLFDFKHGLLDFKHGLLDFKHAYIVNLDNSMK